MADSTSEPAAAGVPVQVLAGSTAHALNNGLALLVAAADYLDDLPDSPALDKVRKALDSADARVQVISDALNLLGLGPADLAQLVAGEGRQAWTPALARRVREALARAARVSLSGPPDDAPAPSFVLDGETLKCTLVCLAVALRRAVGEAAALRCELRCAPGGAAWAFEFHAALDGAPAPVPRSTDHPCEVALGYASALLPAVGVVLGRGGAAGWRVATAEGPGGGA